MLRNAPKVCVVVLALASIGVSTFVAAQKARRSTPTKPAIGKTAPRQRPGTRTAPSQAVRQADPNRAPQAALDDALYSNEEFFGVQASVMRPYAAALDRVTALISKYPKDALLRLHAARLARKLGQLDRATAEMNEYISLKGRSPVALRRLSRFYHGTARFTEEVATLKELAAALPVSERAPVYKHAAEIVRTRALRDFKPADFFAELVAADPSNIQPVKDYVEELRLAKQYKDALSVLAEYQPKFESELAYFLRTRAQILESTTGRRAAEEVYSSAFDPNWNRAMAADYYDLLRRFGRYRIVRRALQERAREGATDLDTNARLFSIFAYEGNYEQASRLLLDLEARRTERSSTSGSSTGNVAAAPDATQAAGLRARWTAQELETVAGMFTSIGHYDQASRYLYTLYLTGGLEPGSEQRERALHRLFKVMIDASGTPTRTGVGDLSFYRDVAEVDQHPGFMNGVLSLILSGTDPAQEFANQERAAAGYYNRAFAYRIFSGFKQEYAQSSHLGEMYLDIVRAFAALGEHKLAIETGREFQQRFPDSQEYADVSLRIADSHVALKDRKGERGVLAGLLDRMAAAQPKGIPLVPASPKRCRCELTPQDMQWLDGMKYNAEAYSDTYDPTEHADEESAEESEEVEVHEASYFESKPPPGPNYSSVLERYVASLAAEEKKTETVAFFWGEIKKHSKEEGLYERFLRWLGQAQLIDDQLKAYNSAIRQFDSNTWYHRLARWYVREKRGRELSRYSRQLIDIFDEEEITEYLNRFAGFGAAAEADQLNWDQRLAFDLYSYAQKKFPRNVVFVLGMLDYLEKSDRARWEKLSAEYYFADRSIRDSYLAWLSKQGQLRERYAKARRADAGTRGRGDTGTVAASAVFAADAAMWLSHHDEALDAYRKLVSLYPGEPQYAERLADLTRSFGQQSDALYEESARTMSDMAAIYPTEHVYRIKAGEVYAQLGDFKRAGEQWDKLIEAEPGDRETYLEVATVYWDYYQFDNALRVFRDLRNVTGDQTIYAYRMGAVHEAKGDMDSAIPEYVKVLPEPGNGRDTVAKRLAQLSRRKGLAEKIAASYERERAEHPGEWRLVIGFASYQAERRLVPDALALIRTEVSRSSDVEFLETVRDLFRRLLRPEDERQVAERLAGVARDERESMMYRLQLASLLERQRQTDAAIGVIDRLAADYPTNVGVVEESAQFYWRAGLVDRSLDLYKRTIARSRGPARRSLTLQLARRQIDASKLADAEATLRAIYDEDRSDTEVFGELARTLGAANKLAELGELYRSALKDVGTGLGGDEARMNVSELRNGMIRTLDSLGKYQEALDQHIEIVNLFPEDAERLGAAIEYADEHNLTERLTGYYEKLTKESYKNYRWQLVLGRIYERRGNLPGAAEQYRGAVVNEPQRTELRMMLASSLSRQRRYDEAIAVLRDGWALAGHDPQWLIEVASIQVRQGNRDDAVKTMREALAAKKNPKAEDTLRIASLLAGWGINEEAARVYEETFARLPKTLKDDWVDPASVAGYVRALVRIQPAEAAFQKLELLRNQYQAIGANSQDTDGYKARSIVGSLDQAMRSDFGRGVIDYATPDDAAALAAVLKTNVARFTLVTDRERSLRYLGIARGAGLVDVEEQAYTQVKDAAFKARTRPDDTRCYNELRALVSFYGRHGAYTRAAEALSAEYARDQYKDRFDYQNQIAAQYRLAGDTARELAALRTAHATSSGALTADNIDWVDRYLTLIYKPETRSELTRLASTYNPHQLQLVNFLISKNEKSLAQNAIARTRLSSAWVASRSGEVGLFLKDTSTDPEIFFRSALGIKPIGEMLGKPVDTSRTLVGDDWFTASRNYGYWLAMVGREADSRKTVAAEIEGHPSVARAQLELAAFYLDRKTVPRAAEHVALAAELAPGSNGVAAMRGAVALARGDRKAALEAWAAMMGSRATIGDAQAYLKVMADNGFLREALPAIERFIVAYVNRPVRGNESDGRMEAIKPLVREIAERAGSDARQISDTAAMFQAAVTQTPADVVIGRMLIEEGLLPEASLAGVYRTINQRITDMAASVFGTSEYDNGYFTGTDYFYPAQEMRDWRRRFVDYLIRTGAMDQARLLIATIRKEQADLALALENPAEESSGEDRYDWLPLASALIELRGSRDASKAVAELRRYCGLAPQAGRARESGGSGGSIDERCLKAYALLVQERRATEADALLYDAYQAAARSRYSDDASLAGLAEIEARRGRSDEAGRLLKLLVERSSDSLKAFYVAAETAARIGRYGDAIDFRDQIARANPDDAVNRLELARVMVAAGRAREAVERLVPLIVERTPNTVRAQAVEALGQIVTSDKSQAEGALALLNARAAQGSAEGDLANAAIAEATGRVSEAEESLARVRGPLEAIAQLRLGLIARRSGRDSQAIAAFERAVWVDGDETLTGALGFAASGPRAQLIHLYARVGRDSAAIRLAEGDEQGTPSPSSLAVRGVLRAIAEHRETPAATSFEPSLELLRPNVPGMRTLAELNTAAAAGLQRELLPALAESAAKLGQYDRAIAIERFRAAEATRAEEKAAIEKRLAEIIAADRARKTAAAALLRINRSNATESIYAARILGP